MNRNKTISSVLIKPAGPDCNLDCTYCFYLKKTELFSDSNNLRISEDILEETVQQSIQPNEKDFISFVKAELLFRIDLVPIQNLMCKNSLLA